MTVALSSFVKNKCNACERRFKKSEDFTESYDRDGFKTTQLGSDQLVYMTSAFFYIDFWQSCSLLVSYFTILLFDFYLV